VWWSPPLCSTELDAEEGEGLAEAAGHLLGGLLDVGPAGQAEQADRDVAHRRHDLGHGASPHLGAVLVVGTVPDVVLAVLDLPVAAVVGEQVGWVRLLRGEAR
jgi:hypothetical protein